MLYIIGLLSLYIGIFSPALGLLIIVLFAAKYFIADTPTTYKFFIGWFLLCAILYLVKFFRILQFMSLTFGLGLCAFLFFYLLNKEITLDLMFLFLLLINIVFVVSRHFLFFDIISSTFNMHFEESISMISPRFASDSEQMQLFIEMMDYFKKIYLQLGAGIYVCTMMLCLLISYFFLQKKNNNLISINLFQTHVYIIYALIGALAIAVFTKYKIPAINYLIAVVPLFMWQGIAVIKVKMEAWQLRSKFLIILAVVSLIINPYIVLFVSVIGLCDNWFDFRKLSNTEDLNENHSN